MPTKRLVHTWPATFCSDPRFQAKASLQLTVTDNSVQQRISESTITAVSQYGETRNSQCVTSHFIV